MSNFGKIALLGMVAAAFACEDGNKSAVYTLDAGMPRSVALQSIEDCGDLEQSLKDQMATRMEEGLDANLQYALDWITNQEDYCYCWGYGETDADVGPVDCMFPGGEYDASAGVGTNAPPPPNARAEDYSTTNNQVAGVAEADFIKNDGSHIYMVSGNEFLIMAAWPADSTQVIASVQIEGTPTKLFVADDHAVIYSDVGEGQTCSWDGYGYVNLGSELLITVFDITDRALPVLDREVLLTGSYLNSRRIGAAVHTVVLFPQPDNQLNLPTWPEDIYLWDCTAELTEAEVTAAFEALREANLAAIADVDLGDFLPSATDTDYLPNGTNTVSEGLFVDCNNFYEPASPSAPGYLSVVSLDILNDTTLGAASILGRGGEVYASHENLYVAVKESSSGDYYGSEQTAVHKFELATGGAAPNYSASGAVPGRLINQFAMDEHDDRLRIATTEGHLPSPDCSNNLFVLEEFTLECVGCYCDPDAPAAEQGPCCLPCEAGPILSIVGDIRDIAPTEDIRSVRFDGDRGFMVTFKKTDPLYAFDLSNPTNPVITGELKIPGFSTYMHFIDENHLLTIGFDADDQGSFAWFTGVMLQIFDVSDMSLPTLTFKEIIGTRGSTSDATDDHLAFNFFKARDLLAIPMGICEESGGGGSYGNTMTFNGLLVYRVTADNGFTLVGGVDHRDAGVDTSQYDCYNWWSNPNSQVKRSVFMDDFVYSISPEKLKVNGMAALDTDLVSIDLPQSASSTDSYCGGW